MKEKTEYPTAPPNLKLVFKLLKKYSPTAQNATIKMKLLILLPTLNLMVLHFLVSF